MVLVDVASQLLSQGTIAVTAITSLVLVIIKFALSRTHNPRLVAVETKIQGYDQAIIDLNNKAKANTDQELKVVKVADVLVPQLSKAADDHSQQINELEKQLAAVTAKVNLVQTIVPAVIGGVVASAPGTVKEKSVKNEAVKVQ